MFTAVLFVTDEKETKKPKKKKFPARKHLRLSTVEAWLNIPSHLQESNTMHPGKSKTVCCKFQNMFSCCLNISTNRLWLPCPGNRVHQREKADQSQVPPPAFSWLWSRDIYTYHWNLPTSFTCTPWAPVKALAHGALISLTLSSPPTWLSRLLLAFPLCVSTVAAVTLSLELWV